MGDVSSENVISQDLISTVSALMQQHKCSSGVIIGRAGDQAGNDVLTVGNISLSKARISQSATSVPLGSLSQNWLSGGCHCPSATAVPNPIPSRPTDVYGRKDEEQAAQATAGMGVTPGDYEAKGNGTYSCPNLATVTGRQACSDSREFDQVKNPLHTRPQGIQPAKVVNPSPVVELTEEQDMQEGEAKVLRELPCEVLQLCLARVPYRFHARLKAVCRHWRILADGQRLLQIRREADRTEVWTFILENEYDYYRKYLGLRGHAYNLYKDGSTTPPPQAPYGYIMWDGDRPYVAPFEGGHPIARLQTPLRLEYGAAGAEGLLFVMGGRPALNGWHTGFSRPPSWEVFSRIDVYNPATNTWGQVSPMPVARYAFATGAMKEPGTSQVKVLVAGGFGTDETPLDSAHVYDPATDTWRSLPPMLTLKGSCRGQVVDGRFMVKQLDGGHFIEALDFATKTWSILLDHGQVELDPLNIGDMNNNRSRNFTSLDL